MNKIPVSSSCRVYHFAKLYSLDDVILVSMSRLAKQPNSNTFHQTYRLVCFLMFFVVVSLAYVSVAFYQLINKRM